MKRFSKKYAREILDLWKDETAYFDGSFSYGDMETLLRNRMGFGQAETTVIIMALIMAGAKFAVYSN